MQVIRVDLEKDMKRRRAKETKMDRSQLYRIHSDTYWINQIISTLTDLEAFFACLCSCEWVWAGPDWTGFRQGKLKCLAANYIGYICIHIGYIKHGFPSNIMTFICRKPNLNLYRPRILSHVSTYSCGWVWAVLD